MADAKAYYKVTIIKRVLLVSEKTNKSIDSVLEVKNLKVDPGTQYMTIMAF